MRIRDILKDKGGEVATIGAGRTVHEAVQELNSHRIGALVVTSDDGSIQGMSARMKWPGYYNGIPNGVWNAPPEQLIEMVHAYHKSGAHIHMHVNGDEASEMMIDAVEEALTKHPRRDHRHTLQHCQLCFKTLLSFMRPQTPHNNNDTGYWQGYD